jgi:hypothetical protein
VKTRNPIEALRNVASQRESYKCRGTYLPLSKVSIRLGEHLPCPATCFHQSFGGLGRLKAESLALIEQRLDPGTLRALTVHHLGQ